jgi:hypothetical protein
LGLFVTSRRITLGSSLVFRGGVADAAKRPEEARY